MPDNEAMTEAAATRSGRLADRFEATHQGFIRLVESLSDEQWRLKGKNDPNVRLNDEDEGRPIGLIADHVAMSGDWIMGRIQAVLLDQPTPPVDFKEINAKHAARSEEVSKGEVLDRLRKSGTRIVQELRAIPDEKLDLERELPSGTMTVQQRIERVLIGHIESHHRSIAATVPPP
jgi:hypothetical protein